MCRLYGFRANEPTKVECGLVHAQNALMLQSRSDLGGRAHPDGWGIAAYHDGTAEIERRAAPAYEGLHFSAAAERVFAEAVVAHVRRATVGGASLENTHPFSHACWTFAHNGTLMAFEQLRPQLHDETDTDLQTLQRGSTDSETIFLWLLSRMRQCGISLTAPQKTVASLQQVLADSLKTLAGRCEAAGADRPAKLNVILTDGHVLVAARWNNPLVWALREGLRDCEFCGIPHVQHDAAIEYRAVVIASEPITHETWHDVPDRAMLTVDDSIHPEIVPLERKVKV